MEEIIKGGKDGIPAVAGGEGGGGGCDQGTRITSGNPEPEGRDEGCRGRCWVREARVGEGGQGRRIRSGKDNWGRGQGTSGWGADRGGHTGREAARRQ